MSSQNITIEIKGMACGHCQKRVTSILENTKGVISANVNLEKNRADITFDPALVSLEQIKNAVNESEIYSAN